MPYDYLDDVATADIAFEAWGETLEEMFIAAADATINVMVENINDIELKEKKSIVTKNSEIDLLLYQFLQELIYYKDADQILLRVKTVHIHKEDKEFILTAHPSGEKINPEKHKLKVDIKAITLHQLKVEKTETGYKATVVVDV